MFAKTFKKVISMFVIAAMLISVMPVVGMADVTESRTINFSNGTYVRTEDKYNETNFYDGTDYIIRGGGVYRPFFQIDFSNLEDYDKILKAESTKVTFSIHVGDNSTSSSHKTKDFKIYVLNGDDVDNYNATTLTPNTAPTGLLDTPSDDMEIGSAAYDPGTREVSFTVSDDIVKKRVLDALNSGTNSVITFTVRSTNNSFFKWGVTDYCPNPGLTIAWDPGELANDQDVYDEIRPEMDTWANLFPETEEKVLTSATELPTLHKGIAIAWESSVPGVIADDGKTIIQKKGEAVTTTLTGTLTYGNAQTAPVVFENVSIPAETPTVAKIEIETTNIRSIDSVESDGNLNNWSDNFRTFHMESYPINSTDKTDRHTFLRWNLQGYRSAIAVAESIKVVLPSVDNAGGENGMITILNDRYDNWVPTKITYNSAIADGLYSDPGIQTTYYVDFGTDDMDIVIDGAHIKSGIQAALDINPANDLVSFRLSSMNATDCKMKLKSGEAPYIEITYYESDVPSAAAPTIFWDAISNQDKNNVVADLDLPSTWAGKEITWSVEGAGIDTEGNVTSADAVQTPMLTATIDEVPYDFELTIPPVDVAVKSVVTHTGITKYNYSSGFVFANEALSSPVDIIQATYDGNKLIAVKAITDVAISAGMNYIEPTGYEQTDVSGLKTKIIVVDDMSTLTPLAVAK